MILSRRSTTDIRIIGPRQSGKTTYLATLAYCPHKKELGIKFPGLQILPTSPDAENLSRLAEDIIMRGAKIAGDFRRGLEVLPFYYFQIKIPPVKGLPSVSIDLAARDFAGEIFDDIPLAHKWTETEPYIDDLFTATGWMVMLTDWEPERDTRLYKPAFTKLCQEISEREQINPEIKKLRIAIVMSKCERGEIWPSRLEADEDLFKVRLPKTYEILNRKLPPERLQFFACSAFGVMCDRKDDFDPRPNRYIPDDGTPAEYSACLRQPSQWKPYGLISPIYWLATGKILYDRSL